jgi:hypothetical protein
LPIFFPLGIFSPLSSIFSHKQIHKPDYRTRGFFQVLGIRYPRSYFFPFDQYFSPCQHFFVH